MKTAGLYQSTADAMGLVLYLYPDGSVTNLRKVGVEPSATIEPQERWKPADDHGRGDQIRHAHPHAEAIYSVVPLDDGPFGVEVIVPETDPTRVSGFATEIAAGAWIETHKRQVELNLPYRRPKPRGG